MVVSFTDYQLPPRFDNKPWTQIRINESDDALGPWNLIDTIDIDPPDNDPANPRPRSFTTDSGTIPNGWYRVDFADTIGNIVITTPLYNSPSTGEIMASLTDIEANLSDSIVDATSNNTYYIQISVARIIRGYLSRFIDNATLLSWQTPETTPDIIREAAAKLIASTLYQNQTSKTSNEIADTSFAQRRYDEGMAILQAIIDGKIDIPGLITVSDAATTLDFWPIDDTDRAFTMSQEM